MRLMSTAAPTNTARRINRLLTMLANTEKTVDGYRKLLALAKEIGVPMEYETERLTRNLQECEDDEEDMREQLIALGYTPE
jgi:sulfur transfer protein SufE